MPERKMNYHNLSKIIKSSYRFDATTLKNFVNFLISIDNPAVKRTDFIGLRELIESLDLIVYQTDNTKMNFIRLIKTLLVIILEKNITNGEFIRSNIDLLLENCQDFNETFRVLNNEEVGYVSRMIRTYNSRRYFFDHIDDIVELANEIKIANILEVNDLIDKICIGMKFISREHDLAKSDFEDDYVDLEDYTFHQNMTQTYNTLTDPSNVLKTGMQGFNSLCNGGLERGRGYIVMGISGEGKSGFLLNLAVQIKKNNPHIITKDPNLKPCVAYITQENSKIETLERLYNITTSNDNITMATLDEVIYNMQTIGGMIMTDDNPVNLAIIYKKPFTNDTSFFDEVIDKMKEKGYEVVCILHDYIQRLNSQNPAYRGDIRLELGAIMNEECTIAKDRDIVFVTAGQLNRVADDKIAESKERSKKNLVSLIRRSNIGESIQILHNADVVFLVAREYDDDEDTLYFGIHKVKGRDRGSEIKYVYQPFTKGSTIRLEEDIDGLPVHRDSLAPIPGKVQAHNIITPKGQLNNVLDFDNGKESLRDIVKRRSAGADNRSSDTDKKSTNADKRSATSEATKKFLRQMFLSENKPSENYSPSWTIIPLESTQRKIGWFINPTAYTKPCPWGIKLPT